MLHVVHMQSNAICCSLSYLSQEMSAFWGLCNSCMQGIQISYEICLPTLACLHWQQGLPTNAHRLAHCASCSTSLMSPDYSQNHFCHYTFHAMIHLAKSSVIDCEEWLISYCCAWVYSMNPLISRRSYYMCYWNAPTCWQRLVLV